MGSLLSKATAPFFDMCMAKILDAAGLLRKGVEMVHDDHAGFASVVYDDNSDCRSHFHLLRRYLKMCSDHRLRLSPKKFTLFSKETDIAGLLHKEGGLRPNPPRYQAILNQTDPETVGDVYNCMSTVGWSRSFIPNFAVVEQPVRSFAMKHLGTGRKTKGRANNIKLAACEDWDSEMKANFALGRALGEKSIQGLRLHESIVSVLGRARTSTRGRIRSRIRPRGVGEAVGSTTARNPGDAVRPICSKGHSCGGTSGVRRLILPGALRRRHVAEGRAVPPWEIPVDRGRGPQEHHVCAALAKAAGKAEQGESRQTKSLVSRLGARGFPNIHHPG